MRVCYVSAYHDPSLTSGIDVIQRNYTVRELAGNVAALGHQVDVVHLFHQNERLRHDGVTHHFVCPARSLTWPASLIACLRGRPSAAHYLPGFVVLRVLREIQPDVVHFFGLTLDVNLWLVSRYARRRRLPLVVQYHGGDPARSRIRRALQRSNARLTTRFLFTTEEHAQAWIDGGIPLARWRIVPFMETSSVFEWHAREGARAETGIVGGPVFLWTGRLHPEKDPVTALRGFERVRRHWPGAQLYMYYLTDEMLPQLQELVARQPCLAGSVHFQGRAPYDSMEAIYNSADFFMQGSTRETSGCAVLEAMSCGVVPVVSDIPSFRAMTDNGRYGVLFTVGNVDALVDGVLGIPLNSIGTYSAAVRSRWQDALSFPALARQLDEIYRDAVDDRRCIRRTMEASTD